jgi:hypothetical protein
MSNFVLSPDTQSKIADLLQRAYDYGFNNVGFVLPDAAKSELASCFSRCPDNKAEAIYYAL